MGHLQYDSEKFEVDDRLLSHLQVVIAQKARRRENFMLTLHYRPYGADVMSSLWFSHSSSVQFAFAGSRPPQLNQVWLEEMMAATRTTQGLDTARVPEPVV